MVVGLVAASALGVGAWLAGRAGGGGISAELLTKKEYISTQITETYAPTITKTFDIQYITAREGSQVITKKEQELGIAPQITVVPTTAQASPLGAGAGAGAGINIYDMLIVAGIITGGYILIKKIK